MKKRILKSACLVLVFSMLFSVCACKKKPQEYSSTVIPVAFSKAAIASFSTLAFGLSHDIYLMVVPLSFFGICAIT